MSHLIDPTWLLLIPFLTILTFCVWALWNFSGELHTGKRRRIHRTFYAHEVQIYWPEQPVSRFRHSRDKEAA
jgi:hypothetical protein